MDSNINFKDLWAAQTSTAPNVDDLFLKIKELKKAHLKRLIFTNVLLVVASAYIIFVWIYYQPQLLTTKIGIVLSVLAMAIFLFAYNQSFSLLKDTSTAKSNNEYLTNLLAIKAKQQFMETTMMNIYYALLSIGICLYLYEYTSRMTLKGAIFAYGITLAWIAFSWLYIRPRQIKKQRSKINDLIAKFESLKDQLGE